MNLVNTDLPRFCPRENCSHFQDIDNLITKAGTYTTKNDPVPRQLYWCNGRKINFPKLPTVIYGTSMDRLRNIPKPPS